MSAVDVFRYAGQQVRTVLIDGEPWFMASDVCSVLEISNPSQAMTRLDADEVTLISNEGRPLNVINEPGLYSLILGSRKPEAKAFKRWVTHEVLPQIRRTGRFVQTEIEHRLPTSFADALRELAASVERQEALEAKVEADAPKVAAYDAWMDADGFYSMDAVAKILGLGRNRLFAQLREAGVIMIGSRRPYQQYMHHFELVAGTAPNGHAFETTKVLPSGVPFIAKKLGIDVAVAA